MISVKVRNLKHVQDFLRELPRGVLGVATRAAAETIVGDESRGLRHYPGYKFVSRKSAYGQTFVSAKQRAWFFANLAEGKINPGQDNRTGEIREGWKITGTGTQTRIVNRARGVNYVMGNRQARQPAKAGWRTVDAVIQAVLPSTIRAMVAAANNWIREHIR